MASAFGGEASAAGRPDPGPGQHQPTAGAAVAEAMSAMLASAMPEVNFADPVGSAGLLTLDLPGLPEVPASALGHGHPAADGS